MNLITKDEFHNMFINCFNAVPANDLVKCTTENTYATTNVLNVLVLERGAAYISREKKFMQTL